MTFSIVIPSYNGAKYIERTLLSVINQTRKPDEIIVHDDNSSDETRAICEKYASKISCHLNVEGPSGFVNGWNRAIQFAKGDYISILHQDDIFYPTFLEEAEKTLNQNPDIRHLFAVCDYIDENDIVILSLNKHQLFNPKKLKTKKYSGKEYAVAYQQTYDEIPHVHRCPGVITHRTIFEEGCNYNSAAGHIADDDFFYRVGQFTDVIGLLKPLSAYRLHQESETGSIGDIKLVQRLAKDYIYQVKQWENSSFIDSLFFQKGAVKFMTRLFTYAYKTKDALLKEHAKVLYADLKEMKLERVEFKSKIKLEVARIINNLR
jgi:glycosyltransferase involved in cell wall biosynthesis